MFIFDTNSFRVLGNYFPDVFPSFWDQLETIVRNGDFGSVKEVKKELDVQNTSAHIASWSAEHDELFTSPSEDELQSVAEILAIPHFTQLIGEKQRLRGFPVADPFLISRARVTSGIVVTEEILKPVGSPGTELEFAL